MNPLDGARLEAEVLAGLKGFQRTTVDHVFHELYERPRPATRFLVADEVGLGKTLVARGLIARAIRRLQERGTRRIDVVYICSNAAIAEQNIRRLNITGDGSFERPTRLTLLPRQVHALDRNPLNFISLTPGTSFEMGDPTGKGNERTLILRLLEHVLGEPLERTGAIRLLQAGMREDRFRDAVRMTPGVGSPLQDGLDPGLADGYGRELRLRDPLLHRFRELMVRLEEAGPEVSAEARQESRRVVRELRLALARACVGALEPDLVILDEFQRFRDLLDAPDPEDPDDVRHLIHDLYRRRDPGTDEPARILLLSATPYRMYTLRDEEADDHYADFLRTVRFLLDDDTAMAAFTGELRDYRRALLDLGTIDHEELMRRKGRLERRLRRVVVRTERLAVTESRSGMLVDRAMDAGTLRDGDFRAYAGLDRMSRRVGGGDLTDYWKSAPYLLSYLGGYQARTRIEAAAGDPEVVAALEPGATLHREDVDAYAAIEPGNPRLRALAAELADAEAWRLLWVPPSLPYHRGRGAWASATGTGFTKRLLFSSWNLVPDAVSTLLSYDAERRMIQSRETPGRAGYEDRTRQRGLLAIRRTETGAPAGMSTFALLYPSLALARIGDPLEVTRKLRRAGGGDPSADEVLDVVRKRVARALSPIIRGTRRDGPEDARWYAYAPLLLDRARPDRAETVRWLGGRSLLPGVSGPGSEAGGRSPDDAGAWGEHVRLAQELVREGGPASLGRVPADLVPAVADLAVGGPGTCALRALARILARLTGGQPGPAAPATRDAALRIAWGFRSLYNLPEVMSLLRGGSDPDEAYWRRAAEEGVSGNLQAVLDEYLHLLPEWLGRVDQDAAAIARRMADEVHAAVTLKVTTYQPDAVTVEDGRLRFRPLPIRARFAVRFGKGSTERDEDLDRAAGVRSAFNSPFWPFVLTSTSVGQEGLDFHLYCHAVVHWNLPANPVDLEQREGRVHRYKGHAVRRNVAALHADAAFRGAHQDPWEALFRAAAATVTDPDHRDIRPFWVCEGPHAIERRVPLIPLSREVDGLRRLRASLAAYRLVFGQPRQEDLLAYLGDRVGPEALARLAQDLRIDLTPPTRRYRSPRPTRPYRRRR